MSKFNYGDRVAIKTGVGMESYAGMVGTVTNIEPRETGTINYSVRIDNRESAEGQLAKTGHVIHSLGAREDMLEYII